ncbi:MAG: apolipoprotein N-acyltransferase [Fimbriimonas sp.]
MKHLQKYGPGLVSALLLSLAFPPFNLALLVFPALTTWLLSLRDLDAKRSFRSGYGFGLMFSMAQLLWIQMFVTSWTGSLLMGAVPWLVAATLMAVYFGIVAMLISKCWQCQAPWAIPLVWAGIEVIRSYMPVLAFPWGLVALPLANINPLAQAGFFGGIYLVSAWVLTIATLCAVWLQSEFPSKITINERPAKQTLATMALLGLVLTMARPLMTTETETKRVSIIQPGVDMAFGKATKAERLADVIPGLLAEATVQRAQGAILPEGIAEMEDTFPPQSPVTTNPPISVLLGGKRGIEPRYQSAFAYDASTREWQSVDKTRLVIFGEFVPGRNVLPFLQKFNLPSGDLEAGKDLKSIDWLGQKWGPIICFEALFPDIAWRHSLNGARSLAVMSIDDWFMNTPAIESLRLGSLWRSIETGLPLMRAGSLGASLATDRFGRVVAEVPLRDSVAFQVDVAVPKSPQGGLWQGAFPVASAFFAVVALFWRRPLADRP